MIRWCAWIAWAALMLLLRLASLPSEANDGLTAVLASLPFALLNTVVLVAAVHLSNRYPLGAGRVVAHGRIHLAAALVFVGASVASDALLRGHLPTPPPLSLATSLFLDVVNYALLAGAAHALEYARRARRTAAAELRLRVGLEEAGRRRAEAELRALKAELNPHFLGNALHAVSALLHSDVAAADRVLAHLGALLRETVARTATQEVTLEEEVAGLEPFLAIERARLGGGLAVEWDVAPDTLAARVPHLILQPLVENAVSHGLAPRGGGRVTIAAHRTGADGSRLVLRVTDDGAGLTDVPRRGRHAGRGVGLANTRERLRELYGEAEVELAPGPTGRGVAVSLTFPFEVRLTGWVETTAEMRAMNAGLAAGRASAAYVTRESRPMALWPLATLGSLWAILTGVSYDVPLASGVPSTPTDAITEGFGTAFLWTAAVYAAVRVTERWPIERRTVRRNLPPHLLAALAMATVSVGVKLLLVVAIERPARVLSAPHLAISAVVYALLYAALTGIAHAAEYARRFWRTEAAELRLRVELEEAGRRRAEAELRALKAELNPHFLGNALHAVSALLHSDVAAADRVLAHLGALLRETVARTATQEVTLEEEVAGLEPFLAIERARLGGGLAVEWDVAPDTLAARVPHLILQPLVENAVSHGLAPGVGGRVTVAARRSGGTLQLAVTPTSQAGMTERPAPDGVSPEEVMLANARARLVELYGPSAALALEAVQGGTQVRVTLPFVDEVP